MISVLVALKPTQFCTWKFVNDLVIYKLDTEKEENITYEKHETKNFSRPNIPNKHALN
jgi:hypothetical protein